MKPLHLFIGTLGVVLAILLAFLFSPSEKPGALSVNAFPAALARSTPRVDGAAKLPDASESDAQFAESRLTHVDQRPASDPPTPAKPVPAVQVVDDEEIIQMPDNASPPVVFVEATNVPAENAEIEEQILDRFVASLKGEDVTVKNWDYAARWEKAKAEADESFRLFFGDDALNTRGIQMAGELEHAAPEGK